jgi:hypothetical protein
MKNHADVASNLLAGIGTGCLFLAIVVGYPSSAYAWVPEGCTDCSGCEDLQPGLVENCDDQECDEGNDCADDCACSPYLIFKCDCIH